jgi:hypothetical protein
MMAQSVDMVRTRVPSSVGAAADTRDLGELFEYRIPIPVTVRKSESAMLPFLQQKIAARKLLVYADHSSQHPTNAAELTNGTGKTLDGGPITVFDAGATVAKPWSKPSRPATSDSSVTPSISALASPRSSIPEATWSARSTSAEASSPRARRRSKPEPTPIRNVDQKARL